MTENYISISFNMLWLGLSIRNFFVKGLALKGKATRESTLKCNIIYIGIYVLLSTYRFYFFPVSFTPIKFPDTLHEASFVSSMSSFSSSGV